MLVTQVTRNDLRSQFGRGQRRTLDSTHSLALPVMQWMGTGSMKIQITPTLALDDSEIKEEFIRAAGPGGQNVNKVATAVQLRFDVLHSPTLPDAVRQRLMKLAGSRITTDGVLVLTAQGARTQIENRQDALKRLIALIRQATIAPKPHYKTKPTRASKERRLEAKKRSSAIKRLRRVVPHREE